MDTIPYSDTMDYKMVIAVRKDIEMGKGKMAAQVAHAAVTCAINSFQKDNETYQLWFIEGQRKVVVKVDDLNALYALSASAVNKDIEVSLIRDAGRTQIEEGTITCVGIGPDLSSKIDEITKNLKLM